MLIFEEKGKLEYPEKNLSEQRRELTPNSTHIRHHHQDLNPGHIGGRRVLSPQRHPMLLYMVTMKLKKPLTQEMQ